jgi:2-amino-4-hydroxy-6-hydroxymethyldihydropteridine diphosphokinase
MATVYVGLGSNLGDRETNLRAALRHLDETPEIDLVRVSAFRRTAPWGVTDQPEFLNALCEIRTTLAPEALLRVVKSIERALGRTVGPRWGPRLIDIDLLDYDRRRYESPTLTLPHPGIISREFISEPLREFAPDLFEELCGDASLSVRGDGPLGSKSGRDDAGGE